MAKGFGEKRNQEIGFALLFTPEGKAYAARKNINEGQDEPFLGITKVLEDAQIWRTKKEVQKASNDYIPLILEELIDDQEQDYELKICSVSKDKKGKLSDRLIEKIVLRRLPEDAIVEANQE